MLPDPHPPAGTFSRWEKDIYVERFCYLTFVAMT
jgi:hypothetical protein